MCVWLMSKMLSLINFTENLSRGLDIPPPSVCLHDGVEYYLACLSPAIYGIGPLLDAPQSDFSMPFNVLTITCTMIAFFLTTIISILVRKSGNETEGAKRLNTLLERFQRRFVSFVLFIQQQGKEKEKDE